METHKVLVANRGEIAIRIIESCRDLGVEFVCVYTPVDVHCGHVALAKKLGGDKAVYRISSYTDANELMAVADASGATAVHPGYGFFAEDFRFARRVTERTRKLIFIGPNWRVIRELGDKINTKRLARALGVPTVPGSDKPIYDELEAEEIGESLFAFQEEQGIERPMVLVKASAGGGGMGIEEVHDIDAFRTVFRRIRNYAKRQFGDEGVLIEQRVHTFNHLEVQIAADRHGNVAHFGTRNCTVQSTGRQKRIEVAPGFDPSSLSYTFDAANLLDEITEHSLTMAREVKYDNVGTWEWIVTPAGKPFLMEVNTRIQVENGVSAMISHIKGRDGRKEATGEPGSVNIIAEQIRMGLGAKMGFRQEDILFDGVGIEYRIIAEAPENKFTPWVGKITKFETLKADWVRLHTQVPTWYDPESHYDIPTEYDPNLALAIIWGKDLAEAKARGQEFLKACVLEGHDTQGGPMQTNLKFLDHRTNDILEF